MNGTRADHRSLRAPVALVIALVALVAACGLALEAVRSHVELRAGTPAPVVRAGTGVMDAGNSPAVARNPRQEANVVVVTSIDQPAAGAGLRWSTDGGRTWSASALPLPPGLDRPSEPDVVFAPDGLLYVVYTNLHGAGNTPDHLWLSRSGDGGRSLSPPALVTGPLAFQPRLVVGADGTVFITWLQGMGVGRMSLVGAPSPVMATESTDAGRTFAPPVQVSDGARVRVGAASPAVASDGSLVVLYEDFGGDVRDFQNLEGPVWSDPFALVITRSTDGGESFAAGREIDSAVVPTERFVAYSPPFPSLAAGRDGSLVVVWADGRFGGPEVLLRRSTDMGGSWSGPSRVTADATAPGAQQRRPAVAIAPDGRIDVIHLDVRRDPTGSRTDVYLGASTDAGHSFVDTRVTAKPFDAGVGPAPVSDHPPASPGSRLGLESDDEGALAVWTASGEGTGAPGRRQDVVIARVTVSGRTHWGRSLVIVVLVTISLAAAYTALGARRPAAAMAVRGRALAPIVRAHGLWRRYAGSSQPAPIVTALHLRVAGRAYPVVLPKLRDPRLHVAACLISVQVLGQTSLGFQLSVAQVLIALGVCAVLEILITFVQRRALIWPASALLTGNGVALLLRVPGTHHGDWWSLRGAGIFIMAGALALLSKYALRLRTGHIFNPSNIGLVVCFLILGSARVDPQDLWFGPMSIGLALAYAIVVVGGVLIVRRLRMLALAGTFFVAFAILLGALAATGHCMTARWSVGPVCGGYFWSTVVFSPEILIFMLFMITDPQTAPRGRNARVVYGFGVAFMAAMLAAPQQTEFATKVGILSGLVVVCAMQPIMLRRHPGPASRHDRLLRSLTAASGRSTGARHALASRVLVPGVAALLIIGACAGMVAAAGSSSRHAATADPHLEALGRDMANRPTIPLEPSAVPPVQISPEVHEADRSFTDARARELAHDVVEDLAIQSTALRTLDPKLAATAAYGSWLQRVLRDIRASRRAGRREVPEYRIAVMKLVLASNPNDYQASKEVAVEVRGTVVRTRSGASDGQRLAEDNSPLQSTLAVQRVGAHYLIAADYSPP
ncbi:MAG: hypothetical protein ABR564_09670 [Candidatus Dormibacteria bacterium]